jgi:hypothetical protein
MHHFQEHFHWFFPDTSELWLCGNSGQCRGLWHLSHVSHEPIIFRGVALLFLTSIAVDMFWTESHVFLALIFIGCFMKHFSCDYVTTLKHPESSNGEVVIQGSAQNYIFFHTSTCNLYDNQLISESLNSAFTPFSSLYMLNHWQNSQLMQNNKCFFLF